MKKTVIERKKYLPHPIERGYTNHFLKIHLDGKEPEVAIKEIPKEVRDFFCGGRGFGLWALFLQLRPRNYLTCWDSPENVLTISSGPLAGSNYPGSGKSTVTTISPLTGIVIDSNVGGDFASFLKFAGFDFLSIDGKAKGNLVVFIDGLKGVVEILKMRPLPHYSHEAAQFLAEYFGEGRPQDVAVITTGPAAEKSLYGILNFSFWDSKRKILRNKQAGRGGTGTVMAHKGVRAIVVRRDPKRKGVNPADPDLLKKVVQRHAAEIRKLDPKQNRMAQIGTTHLVEIMAAPELQLLPVNNFQFGTHPEADKLSADAFEKMFNKGYDGCYKGCVMACSHGLWLTAKSGPYKGKRVWVDGPEYETIASLGSNLGIFDPKFVAEANFYCDSYGLDTISAGVSIAFAMECFERGLIDEKITKGLDLRFGNKKAALKLLHQIGRGRGFGKIVGQGVLRMKEYFIVSQIHYDSSQVQLLSDICMHAKGLEFSLYVSKETLAQQGGYGLALKGPQHDEAWLIFEDMVRGNLPEDEDKAEALWWFPMWRTWFGLMGLCKLPWNDVIPEDNIKNPQRPVSAENARAKVPQHVQYYAELYRAVTGKAVKPEDLLKMSERVYNFHRLMNKCLAGAASDSDNIPYRAMGPVTEEEYRSRQDYYDKQLLKHYSDSKVAEAGISEKIKLLRSIRERKYLELKEAVYKRRGWGKDGVPTVAKIKELSFGFSND